MLETELTDANEDIGMEVDELDEDASIDENMNIDMDSSAKAVIKPDKKLTNLLEKYEALKDKIDAFQAERKALREKITSRMKSRSMEYSEVPVPSGRAYKVSLTTRIFETVTREGKSFIKVHSTPELLDSLIKTSERETLAIRELTGYPRQSLYNRLQNSE